MSGNKKDRFCLLCGSKCYGTYCMKCYKSGKSGKLAKRRKEFRFLSGVD